MPPWRHSCGMPKRHVFSLWPYLMCTSHAALSPTSNNKSFAYLRCHIHAIKLYNGKYVGDIFVPFFWGFVFFVLFCISGFFFFCMFHFCKQDLNQIPNVLVSNLECPRPQNPQQELLDCLKACTTDQMDKDTECFNSAIAISLKFSPGVKDYAQQYLMLSQ